jgi:hypothetical protein
MAVLSTEEETMDSMAQRSHYSFGRMAAVGLLVALMCVGAGAAPQALATASAATSG